MSFFVSNKSVPSSANKAASGVSERMSKNAGSDSAMDSGKQHFVGAMQRLAKLRATQRGDSPPLQHGNTLTKKAPMGGVAPFDSDTDEPEGNFAGVQATDAQTALNPKQRGASSKNAQRGRGGRE